MVRVHPIVIVVADASHPTIARTGPSPDTGCGIPLIFIQVTSRRDHRRWSPFTSCQVQEEQQKCQVATGHRVFAVNYGHSGGHEGPEEQFEGTLEDEDFMSGATIEGRDRLIQKPATIITWRLRKCLCSTDGCRLLFIVSIFSYKCQLSCLSGFYADNLRFVEAIESQGGWSSSAGTQSLHCQRKIDYVKLDWQVPPSN